MRGNFFIRMFLLYAAVMVVAGVAAETYIGTEVRDNRIDTIGRELASRIALVRRVVSFRQTDLDDLCREIRQETGARVTIVRQDGKVIGDSDSTSSLMDNHRHRTEIEKAAMYGTGLYIRHSDTVKTDFLYVASKVRDSTGETGFIRLSLPLGEVDAEIVRLRNRLLLVVSLVYLVTWGFGLWRVQHLRRLLRQIAEFSRSLARGDLHTRLYLKGAGEFTEIVENLTTMSEKLRGMIDLSEEEKRRLNVVLDSIPDALLIIDTKGVVVLSSASAVRFFGIKTIVGRQYVEVVRSGDFTDLVGKARQTLSAGTGEMRLDSDRYLSMNVSPLFYRKGEFSGVVAIFHDVTRLRKLEEVRKDFVANISHEIKTPITSIRGFADTLLDGALEDRENAVRFLRTIKSNSERINNLVDDLMVISKLELGVTRIEKEVVQVRDMLDAVLVLFKGRAESRGLTLQAVMIENVQTIEADRNRLIQILTNLVDNAVKFTEKGSVTFGLDRYEMRVSFFVEDTGIGIPEKDLTRLGERFYRVDSARSRTMGGTGLGLAIVKHIIKAHGWQWHIESTPGKGTRIRICL